MTEPVRARYAAAAERLADTPQNEASLGCGNPLAVADLCPGETVLDLGSGAGLDVLVSARRVGPVGRAIGLDMTGQMLALARRHAAEQGVTNVEFHLGRIEDIPLPDDSVDVVISNCVITLSADKSRVFAEIARVLRPGGRIGISDVLAEFTLTDAERAAGADRVECLASSLTIDQYAAALATAGLTGIEVRRTHQVGDKLHAAIIRATNSQRHNHNPVHVAVMEARHAEQVLAIYQAGLNTGNASFETTAPTWATWDDVHLPVHRFVAVDQAGSVQGWIAATPVSIRCVYAGVLEHSVYVHPDHHGHGVGRALLETTSPRQKQTVCGRCNPASSPRTSPASLCTSTQASVSLAAANGSASTTTVGATYCSSSVAAPSPAAKSPPLAGLRIRDELHQAVCRGALVVAPHG